MAGIANKTYEEAQGIVCPSERNFHARPFQSSAGRIYTSLLRYTVHNIQYTIYNI